MERVVRKNNKGTPISTGRYVILLQVGYFISWFIGLAISLLLLLPYCFLLYPYKEYLTEYQILDFIFILSVLAIAFAGPVCAHSIFKYYFTFYYRAKCARCDGEMQKIGYGPKLLGKKLIKLPTYKCSKCNLHWP
ncbi:hypothetical protein ACFL35_04070 [Candidatus Riflebacteria bacterium]